MLKFSLYILIGLSTALSALADGLLGTFPVAGDYKTYEFGVVPGGDGHLHKIKTFLDADPDYLPFELYGDPRIKDNRPIPLREYGLTVGNKIRFHTVRKAAFLNTGFHAYFNQFYRHQMEFEFPLTERLGRWRGVINFNDIELPLFTQVGGTNALNLKAQDIPLTNVDDPKRPGVYYLSILTFDYVPHITNYQETKRNTGIDFSSTYILRKKIGNSWIDLSIGTISISCKIFTNTYSNRDGSATKFPKPKYNLMFRERANYYNSLTMRDNNIDLTIPAVHKYLDKAIYAPIRVTPVK